MDIGDFERNTRQEEGYQWRFSKIAHHIYIFISDLGTNHWNMQMKFADTKLGSAFFTKEDWVSYRKKWMTFWTGRTEMRLN